MSLPDRSCQTGLQKTQTGQADEKVGKADPSRAELYPNKRKVTPAGAKTASAGDPDKTGARWGPRSRPGLILFRPDGLVIWKC